MHLPLVHLHANINSLLFPTTNLESRRYDYLHFTDEKTKSPYLPKVTRLVWKELRFSAEQAGFKAPSSVIRLQLSLIWALNVHPSLCPSGYILAQVCLDANAVAGIALHAFQSAM